MAIKLHLACGDVYLKGYVNCDIDGWILNDAGTEAKDGFRRILILENGKNPNETTLDKYYTRSFVRDSNTRERRRFIIDRYLSPLEVWPFADESVSEIVMVNALEHFEHRDVPHIVAQAKRVLLPGGRFKLSVPDIKATVDKYYDSDPDYCIKLLYCNHKNEYSIHNWGYTRATLATLFDGWSLTFQDFVNHDYPNIQLIAEKL